MPCDVGWCCLRVGELKRILSSWMQFDVFVFWVFAWDDGLLRGVLASYECDVAVPVLEFSAMGGGLLL